MWDLGFGLGFTLGAWVLAVLGSRVGLGFRGCGNLETAAFPIAKSATATQDTRP